MCSRIESRLNYVSQIQIMWGFTIPVKSRFEQNCCNSNMSGWKAQIRLRQFWNGSKQWRVNFGDVQTFFDQPIISWSWPKHIWTHRKNLIWIPRNIFKYPTFFVFLNKIIINIWIASIPHKYNTGNKLQSWFFPSPFPEILKTFYQIWRSCNGQKLKLSRLWSSVFNHLNL